MLKAVFHFAGAFVESLVGCSEDRKKAATAFQAGEIIIADVFHPGPSDPVTVRFENLADLNKTYI